ncbi:hypothetical protein Ddye_020543 [Dipteronia dyeriana]|uniref:Legume lectin domain-containing protein n=1 Tax=Dipteronia dyeriana TaxID=168575 RepID=A0AAD9WWP0_9ROSI|nr:hypothetical protein Ddye_020543 [Dipteronia dyeriana]
MAVNWRRWRWKIEAFGISVIEWWQVTGSYFGRRWFSNDSHLDSSVVRLANDSNQFSFGRAYHPQKLTMKPGSNSTTLFSFSTLFVFSVLPEIASSSGFGLYFVLTNFTSSGLWSLHPRPFSSSVKAVDRRLID